MTGFLRRCLPLCLVRKRCSLCALTGFTVFLCTIVLVTVAVTQLPREELMEQRVAEMQVRIQFIDSMYRSRQEDLIDIQNRLLVAKGPEGGIQPALSAQVYGPPRPPLPPDIQIMLRNMSGTHAAGGFNATRLQPLRMPYVYQLLPHLLNDPNSLRPMYHMRGERSFVNVVLGIPTVRRDKESYLMITLKHLINGLTPSDEPTTLIVVFVGETNPEYVLQTARQIEAVFPKQVSNGLIEVIAPSHSYYPNFDMLEPTLGDPIKRVKWRTKQNLDTIFLMTYCQPKGTFYLMLEDDIIAKNNYMQEIKSFSASVTVTNPQWIILEFCHIGGIGKLFRSSDLVRFVTYIQLFYNNMPIDWLIESYLADKVCTIEKTKKQCSKSKLEIRPRYKSSLFQHIGLYSSLKGKIQKVKDINFGTVPTFYPHANPRIDAIHSTIEEYSDHTLHKAYSGQSFFWGLKPKKGDIVEFVFEKPLTLEKFLFRSGNIEHVSDKFYETTVEILPESAVNATSYITIGHFDEFGLSEGVVDRSYGRISSIRLAVHRDSEYWIILSEIFLKTGQDVAR